MERSYVITDEMVAEKAHQFDWLELADGWGRTLRTDRANEHWRNQFQSIADCLPWEADSSPEVLELCPGSGLITEILLESYPRMRSSLMEVQPIFRRMAFENIRARSGRDPKLFSTDLRDGDWWEVFGSNRFDAIATSDALNELSPETLGNVYLGARKLLNPGGFFFNCDRVGSDSRAVQKMYDRIRKDVFGRKPQNWSRISEWWDRLGDSFGVSGYSNLWLAELSESDAPGLTGLTVEHHRSLLREAGFDAADCVWFYFGDAVLMGAVDA